MAALISVLAALGYTNLSFFKTSLGNSIAGKTYQQARAAMAAASSDNDVRNASGYLSATKVPGPAGAPTITSEFTSLSPIPGMQKISKDLFVAAIIHPDTPPPGALTFNQITVFHCDGDRMYRFLEANGMSFYVEYEGGGFLFNILKSIHC